MSDWLHELRAAWGWTGVGPVEIIDVNLFGNFIIADSEGVCWRIIPEELTQERIAENREALSSKFEDQNFLRDWKMDQLAEIARSALGTPKTNECFCLKIPATLGGKYNRENLGRIAISELIRASGELARQIDDLPDGTPIELKVID
jgi:hypothetical protein